MAIKLFSKMAAVRHLEFGKIAVLVTWPVLSCDSSSSRLFEFRVDRPIRRRDPKTILNMACVRHLEFGKIDFFLSNLHAGNGNLYLCTKFDRIG